MAQKRQSDEPLDRAPKRSPVSDSMNSTPTNIAHELNARSPGFVPPHLPQIDNTDNGQSQNLPSLPFTAGENDAHSSTNDAQQMDPLGALNAYLVRLQQGDDGIDRSIRVINRAKFNTTEIRQRLDMSRDDVNDYAVFYVMILEAIDGLSKKITELAGANDVRLLQLEGDFVFPVSARLPNGEVEPNTFLSLIEQVVQSNQEILTDDTLELVVQIVHNLEGGVGPRRKVTDIFDSELIKKKRMHLIVLTNKDNNLCFATCVVMLLDPGLTTSDAEQKGRDLQTSVGLSELTKVSLSDINKFEKDLGVKIVVFYREGSDIKHFKTPFKKTHAKTVFLYLHDDHYYGITNPKGFLGVSYFCNFCYSGYSKKNDHKCENCCNVCHHAKCPDQPKKTIQCTECLRFCQSKFCHTQHKVRNLNKASGKMFSRCDLTKYCSQCNRRYNINMANPKEHKCGANRCLCCEAVTMEAEGHQCFIQKLEPEEPSEKYIFYDFETRQDTDEHVPNFVCCMDFHGETWTAEGEDCVKAFYKKYRTNKYNGYTFIAHNSKGYDGYFLMKYLVENMITPKITAQGSKLICIIDKDFKQRYIDSLSFLSMKLSDMPEAMGFENDKKGYFPHWFNTQQNQNYIGKYPSPEEYGDRTMMKKERETFLQWHKSKSESKSEFDFKKEMAEYCKNDVIILRKACLRFRDEVLSTTKVDPLQCVTLASLCMKIYRTRFLPEDTIAIPPLDNYIQSQKTFSTPSIQWLEYLSHKEKRSIKHALNDGEKRVGKYSLDGFSEDDDGTTAYEYAGCYFHGCPDCYDYNALCKQTKMTFGVMHQRFQDKISSLQKDHNLNVKVMWDHDWNDLKKTDPEVQTFLKTFEMPEPMEPRDAFFGGRTNALHLHYKVQPGETIQYYDFTSLYPFVNKAKAYPIGHPNIIAREFEPLDKYFGFVKAKVYPPKGLYLPVLPYRAAGKLMFPLCRICSESENQETECTHSDEERALTGVWCTVEMAKAIEKGYKVAKLIEVWHFPKKSESLFTEYVKTFLKDKQEASGWPHSAADEVSKEAYLQRYEETEGIKLNREKIVVNKAMRKIAKLFLNSLWGKFGQRANQMNTTLIKDLQELLNCVFSPEKDVSNISFLNDDVVMVNWKYIEKRHSSPGPVNVFIAAFTTAYARLELYDLMEKLQKRTLYHDTDSVIFVSRPGDWMPELNEFLGGLTSELDPGDHIVEFVSGGPKTYGYKTHNGTKCMKVKGITLHHSNATLVHLESLIGLVNDFLRDRDNSEEISTQSTQIVRDKRRFTLKNRSAPKRFRIVYNKRRLFPDYSTLPYGY